MRWRVLPWRNFAAQECKGNEPLATADFDEQEEPDVGSNWEYTGWL